MILGIDSTLLTNMAIYALLALSVQVSLRAGVFSLSGIGCFAIGAYVSAILVLQASWSPIIAIIAAVLVAALINWILSIVLVRLRSLYLAMATVAFVMMISVVAVNGGDLTGGAVGLFGIPLGVTPTAVVIATILVTAAVAALQSFAGGRAGTVAREDEELAQSLGINVRTQQQLMFTVSGAIGGLAGCFHVMSFSAITPEDTSFALIIMVLTMVILGGYRLWVGAVVGAIALTALPLELQAIGDQWPLVYGTLMIVMAVYAPAGLLGTAVDMIKKLRRRGVHPHSADRGAHSSPTLQEEPRDTGA